MKFEKTHLLDHYQAGADTAACSLEDPPADQLQTANNTSSACHLQTTRSQLNDLAMIDTTTHINEPLIHRRGSYKTCDSVTGHHHLPPPEI